MPVFTDFLNLGDLIQLRRHIKVPSDCILIEYKAFKDDERRMIGFIPSSYSTYMSEEDILDCFPVELLLVQSPFGDKIGHRDLLGAILGLGMSRRLFGDIVFDNNKAFILCHELGAKIIADELVYVGKTNVRVDIGDKVIAKNLAPITSDVKGTLASLRLDGLIKSICGVSRSNAVSLIQNGYVKVNQQETLKSHYQVKEGDVLSVRGKGKYKLASLGQATKKNRIPFTIKKYI